MASWFINSGVRKGTPKEIQRERHHRVRRRGPLEDGDGLLRRRPRDDGYLAVLDRDGRVQGLHHGNGPDEAVAELKAVIARLTAPSGQ